MGDRRRPQETDDDVRRECEWSRSERIENAGLIRLEVEAQDGCVSVNAFGSHDAAEVREVVRAAALLYDVIPDDPTPSDAEAIAREVWQAIYCETCDGTGVERTRGCPCRDSDHAHDVIATALTEYAAAQRAERDARWRDAAERMIVGGRAWTDDQAVVAGAVRALCAFMAGDDLETPDAD